MNFNEILNTFVTNDVSCEGIYQNLISFSLPTLSTKIILNENFNKL